MPRSTRSQALTVAHAAQQKAVGADVARQALSLWGAVDPRNVDAAWPTVARAMSQVVARGYATSTATAAAYLHADAAANGVDLGRVLTAPTLNTAQLETALRVTGPVALKRAAAAGMDPVNAARAAAVQLTGSTSRLALAGGRGTLTATVAGSDGIVGYRRVGSGRSCFFCAMLISRGAAYKSEGSAGANGNHRFVGDESVHKYHDHCSCSVVPLYDHEDNPDDVVELYEKYLDATAGTSGQAAVRAWRQAYDGHISPLPTPSAIIGRDLTTLTDDALAGLLGTAGNDDEIDTVLAELDRRDAAAQAQRKAEADKAARQAARDNKRAEKAAQLDAEYDRRLAAGDDPESAYEDVYGVTVERQRRDAAIASLRATGYKGKNFDELTRSAFRDYLDQSYWDAEAATNGALFRGKTNLNETRDSRKLFNGTEAYARANASEELLAYWQKHGRLTLDDYRASMLGGSIKKGTAAWL